VAEAAARHLTPVTLELGGKSPVILDEACDLDEAARRTVWGKFINAGQTCIAPDYVFVPRSRERAFLDAVKRWIASFYGATEEARKDNGDFCRLVDVGSFERIRGLVERSLSAGAHLEIGGRYDAESRYIAPTVLSGVRPEHAIMSEEIFGPVLPVLPFEDWREVYAYIQKGGKPLALYVFSNRADRTEEVIRETTAGGTAVNQALLHYANPHLPFGGTGESGQGSYHGFFGFKTFSHERAILRQRGPNLTRFLYPPYGTELQRKVLRALRRME
jgi:aldehyde dehydrogenase (NAD+)